ncbi:MAG: nuclear transport factor 2 family protein [Bacteroidota bacterium]
MDIEILSAKQAIKELHYKYAQGVDKKDWEVFRSIFHDAITVDYSKWGMGDRQEMSIDEYTQLVQYLFSTEGLVTQHYMTNTLVEVNGREASGDTYVFARHQRGEEVMNLNAFYTCSYIETDMGWKIRSIEMTPRWDEGADVVNFFQIPDPQPTSKTYLFVTATPIMEHHDALERYVQGIIPMLMQAGGSVPKIIKQDKSVVGHTDTFMSMIVEFDGKEAKQAAHAVFESEAYAKLVPDREKAFSKMNIAFYSDMPQG